jgi:hypothetical protein
MNHYTPPRVSQFAGQYACARCGRDHQSNDCTMAAGAMLVRKQTRDALKVTARMLRERQNDHEGGTDLNDLAIAFGKLNEPMLFGPAVDVDEFRSRVRADLGAVIQGVYANLPPELRLSTFRGGHALFGCHENSEAVRLTLNGVAKTYAAASCLFVMDTIPRPTSTYRGQWWPYEVVVRFAEGWSEQRGKILAAHQGRPTPPAFVDYPPLEPEAARFITDNAGTYRIPAGTRLYTLDGEIFTRLQAEAVAPALGHLNGHTGSWIVVKFHTARLYPDGQARPTWLLTDRGERIA